MAWTYLFIASVFEIIFAVGMKYTAGFTRLVPSVLTAAAATASVLILSQSLKSLPVGTAYAVWTGIGAVGTTLIGIYLFDESRDVLRILCILLIAAGIIGLKLTSAE
ncbi:MAG: quaternary ammonium compound efflux SMR transporter SugE [Acidobacteriota bacterium]|nr:quaternary ammonium compound efflux SMR transporter SugE [Acidobacteriota bacterium]